MDQENDRVGARPDAPAISAGGEAAAQEYALARGMRDTRATLDRWSARPAEVLGPWYVGGLLVALGLLLATWLCALATRPDFTPLYLPGISGGVEGEDFARILGNNFLVLALHATACVAGFIAGSSLPLVASQMTGFRRFVHEQAGKLAIWWVIAVTGFSLVAQAIALGFDGSTLANTLGIEVWVLMFSVLPHALLELTAVFLPLAAWLIASRKNQWEDLLAATFVTVALAIPMLIIAAVLELYVWPEILEVVSPVL